MVIGNFLAIHLSKLLDKLKVKRQPIVLGYFNFRNNSVDSSVLSRKPLSIGLILTNSSLTRVQQAKEIKTIGSLLRYSSCRLLFSMMIGLSQLQLQSVIFSNIVMSILLYQVQVPVLNYTEDAQSVEYQYKCFSQFLVPVTSIFVVVISCILYLMNMVGIWPVRDWVRVGFKFKNPIYLISYSLTSATYSSFKLSILIV